ncbi:MAG TPA: hypothetical protein VFA50_07985 [Stellaceae bacterium]|nr:hypothetical protein [Stellaceae bacterium]
MQWLRLAISILGFAYVLTTLCGEWRWELQLLLGAVLGFVAWLLFEVVWLIRYDETLRLGRHDERTATRPVSQQRR